ncbi:MAG: ABC transporter permease [Planctomycetota bacterium]
MSDTVLIGAQSSPQGVSWNPIETLRRMARLRGLVWQFARRDLAEKYKGSFLGAFWAILTPFLMLATYTFVFNVVLKVRWSEGGGQGGLEYALALFCGLLVYGVFSECAYVAPHLVVTRRSYVKRTVFPLEALPAVALVSALVRTGVGLAILLAVAVFSGVGIGPRAGLFVAVVPALVLFALGTGWFLASLGVFVRDAAHTVAILVQLLFFLTPIVYPVSAVPEKLRALVFLNPFTHLVEAARNTLLWNRAPDWLPLGAVTILGIVVFQAGFVFFERTKRAFADVL